MISPAQCKTYARTCERLARAADISIQRAMVLMAMANSWDTLTLQTARYDDIVKAENQFRSLPAGFGCRPGLTPSGRS